MLPLDRKHLGDLVTGQVICRQASILEHTPFLWCEVEQLFQADRQGHDELVGQLQKDMKQLPLAEVDQA